MITVDFDLVHVRSNAGSRMVQAPLVAITASECHARPPQKGVASDPADAWLAKDETQASDAVRKIALPDMEWTEEHEQRFIELAGREAVGTLTPIEHEELENLSRLRRGSRNPRSGEELIWEYEQRELTRSLVDALNRYVKFHHKSSS
jgi:hypothetical protein